MTTPTTLLAVSLSSLIGLISLLASLCVLLEAGADWRAEGGESTKIVTRIQVILQFPILLLSACYLFLPVLSTSFYGNDASCQWQGFAMQFSVSATVFLDWSLSLVYLLMIRIQMPEAEFRRVEKYVHAILWPFSLIPAIVLLQKRAYQLESGHICWMGRQCDPKQDNDCVVDNELNALDLVRSGMYCVAVLYTLFSLYTMTQVYRLAKRQNTDAGTILARKGLFYASSLLVIQTLRLVLVLVSIVGWSSDTIDEFDSCTMGLVGLSNMLVFMYRRTNIRTGYGRLVCRVLHLCCCCLCCGYQAGYGESKESSDESGEGRDLFASSNGMEENCSNPRLSIIKEETELDEQEQT